MKKAFKTLAVSRGKYKTEDKYMSMFYITEQSLRQNFKKLFNHDCDIFARLLYIKIAREKDHAKIYFP